MRKETTVIVATHDEEVFDVADVIYTIKDGESRLRN
jgi:ABC-type lipoprotein export system ATPase subunit